MIKNIKTNLSSQSITETINQLRVVKSNLEQASINVTEALVEQARQWVQENYDNTTDRPFDEDYSVNTETHGNNGKVIASGQSVIYMEFGTGEIGQKGQQHPKRNEFSLKDFNSGRYVRVHEPKDNATEERMGKNGQHYWFYKGHYTQGISAGLQVYNAVERLKNEKMSIARKVVRDTLW